MKIRSSEIVVSAIKREQYPAEGLPEIALVGRSNVGKSSATNALLNRRNFARTSQTPGKTRTINFYKINNEFYFVDLPGYGYAKVSKSEKDKWGVIMERYLQDRQELCAIFLLVDIRHEPTNDDVMMYEWIKHFGYNCVVIATKADKISRGQYQKHISIIRKKLQLEKDEKVIPLSSSKKTGVEDVWNDIRHEPTNDDVMMYEWIKHFGYNCVVIATKADKISRGQYQKHISIIRKKLQLEKDEKVIPLSSSKKTGVEDVWNEIIAQYEEHGYEITVD